MTARLAMTRFDMFWRFRCSSKASKTRPFPRTIQTGMTDSVSSPQCGDDDDGGGGFAMSVTQFVSGPQNSDAVWMMTSSVELMSSVDIGSVLKCDQNAPSYLVFFTP